MIPEPTGTSPLALYLRKMVRQLNSAVVTSVVGGRLSRGPSGTTIVVDPLPSGRSGGWNFRGTYDPDAAYKVDDVVTVIGSGQGSYLCQVAHGPSPDDHAPWEGDFDAGLGKQYWALLAPSGIGVWL